MRYSLLKEELNNDPDGIGYSGMNPKEVADELNKDATRQNFRFTGAQLINAIEPSEWTSLTDAEKENIRMLVGAGGVLDASENTTTRRLILNAFGSDSATVSNLLAIATESVPRWQVLGLGEEVQPYHVSTARS